MSKKVWKLNEADLADYGLQALDNTFNFKDIEKWLEKDKKMPYLGSGSGRFVFSLRDGYVLKIIRDESGFHQNKSEVEVYEKYGHTGFFTKIIGYDKKNYRWIIAEEAKVWKSEGQFWTDTGLPDDFLDNFCNDSVSMPPTEEGYRAVFRKMSKTPELKEILSEVTSLGKKILKMLFILTSKYKIDDIGRFDHIGILPNGNVVVVDYGLSFGTE